MPGPLSAAITFARLSLRNLHAFPLYMQTWTAGTGAWPGHDGGERRTAALSGILCRPTTKPGFTLMLLSACCLNTPVLIY